MREGTEVFDVTGQFVPTLHSSGEIMYSTLSNHAARRMIVQCYGLDSSIECALYQKGVNDVYLVTDSDRKFALRISRVNWRSRREILEELVALQHLDRHRVPVAMPLARRDGDLVVDVQAPEGLRHAVMFEWVKGRSPKYTEPDHSVQFGRLIGELHTVGRDLPSTAARPQFDLAGLLEAPLELIRPSLQTLPGAADRLDVLAVRLRSRFHSLGAHDLHWGFCHGDVEPNNASIDGNRMVLFDFDACGWGWQCVDLASYRLAAREQGKEDLAWQPFVEGYLQVCPSRAHSLDLIPLFMILRHIWVAGQCIAMSADWPLGRLSDDFFANLVTTCEAIETAQWPSGA